MGPRTAWTALLVLLRPCGMGRPSEYPIVESDAMWGPGRMLRRVRVASGLTKASRGDLRAATSMVDAAQGTWANLTAPSPLATALLMACTTALGIEADSPSLGIAAVATLFGYSARLSRPAATLPIEAELRIGTQLVAAGPNRNRELDPSELGPLLGLAATLADDRHRILQLADVNESVWEAFSAMATMQVRERVANDGVPTRLIPSDRALEKLLRFGYVLRLIDEVADARSPRPSVTE